MSSEGTNFSATIERRGTNTYKWDYRAQNASGEPILPMWVADMDFPAPAAIVSALRARVDHPVYGYTFASGAYREALRAWEEKRNGWRIDDASLVVTPGVMPVVRAAILTFSEPGDEVIIQPPVYFPFFDAVRENGRTVVENPLRAEPAVASDGVPYRGSRYTMDLDALEASISPRTKIILLCSPHNPVGRVWRREELERLARIAERHDLVVIADEIHSDLVRAGHPFVPFATVSPAAAERTIACHAPSKTFNIAGIPSSHTIVPNQALRERLEATLHRLGLTLPNLLAIEAARAGYAQAAGWLDELLRYLDEQIAWFAREVDRRFHGAILLSPIEGTYLAWLDFRPLMQRAGCTHRDIDRALADVGAIWLSEGLQFGAQADGFFRLNLAAPRSLVEDGLARIERTIHHLEAGA